MNRVSLTLLRTANFGLNNNISGSSFLNANKLFCSQSSSIGDEMDLKKVVQVLQGFAPNSLAESWDNVGLLVEPSSSKIVRKIALCNDLTTDVMSECVESNTDLIISYHPPIFSPLKRLTMSKWKEQIVISCIKNDIALYSPHTSFDAVASGVNDWLISPYGSGDVQPISQSKSFGNGNSNQVTLQVDPEMYDVARSVLDSLDGVSLDQSDTKGTLTLACSEKKLSSIVNLFSERPGLFKDIRINKLEKVPIAGTGAGRTIKLDSAISLREAVERTKKHLGLPHVRLALGQNQSLDSPVTSVAVCAGAGTSVLAGVPADLLVTGEMPHHVVLDAVHAGSSVILCEHSNTERGYLTGFAEKLSAMLNDKVEVFVSTQDRERLVVV